MFNKKGEIKERLAGSYGKLKDDSFNFELIEKYFRKKDNSAAFQVLSDKTCKDIDFDELFMFVDRTTSKIGQQFLYNILRIIPSNSDKFNKQEKLIDKISKDSNLRLNIQLNLNKLDSDEVYYITSLFQDEHLERPKWFFIIPLLSFTSLLSILLIPFIFPLFFVLIGVFIINMCIHYWNKRNLYQYIGTIPQLLRLNGVAKELLKYDLFDEISLDMPGSIATINKVRNRMSFFNLEVKLQAGVQVIFWTILEFVKTLFLLEPLLLFGVLKQLDTKRKEIEKVFSFVGYVDSLISIASLRQGLNFFCLPGILNNNKILEAREIYHPLIINCVSNSINVNDKSILLTGSNMSGKTSFIRAIGISAITGLTINTCFAKQFSMARTKVYSAIRISDDLVNDKSYYFEEVLTIKEMIANSGNGEPNLFLLDEIFKGTNSVERISAGKAVLSFLSKSDNIIFVSTHDIELADLLKDEYELYHFSEKVNNKTVDFDYKLKEGKLKNRNAIRILQINDYPESVIKEATEISKELDKIGVL
jgi:hypothetical protein